jgi:hypothetical protein
VVGVCIKWYQRFYLRLCLQTRQTEREVEKEKMATEGHRQGPRGDHKQMRKEEMDKELNETREELNRLMLQWQRMQQGSWRYEWPMKGKVKWPIQQLISRKQKQMLKRWLRQVENLSDTEEEMVYICEPEIGESLDEEEERSVEDLTDFQEGNEKRSVKDLIDCQEGRNENSGFQVGKEEVRLSESLENSEESSYQQGVLTGEEEEAGEKPHQHEDSCGVADHVNEDDEKLNTSTLEEEDQRCILIIGGIGIFLPSSPTEASACVAHEEVMQEASREEAMGPNVFKTNSACVAGAGEGRQPTETVMEEEEGETSSQSLEGREDLNHVLMVGEIRVSLGEGLEENSNEDVSCKEADRQPTDSVISEDRRRRKEEHSVELLINCSKGDEQRTTAELEPTAGERANNMDFVDLCEELEALGERVITQSRLIQQVKLEIDEEEEMQQSRLQERSQPMDKMDREIEEIRRLMLKSTKETVNN